MPYPVRIVLCSLAGAAVIIAVAMVLSACSGLCGYHGSGCGYTESNPRSMANMTADQLRAELSK